MYLFRLLALHCLLLFRLYGPLLGFSNPCLELLRLSRSLLVAVVADKYVLL